MTSLLGITNLVIAAAYVTMGFLIVPRLRLPAYARPAAMGFFILCGLHHLIHGQALLAGDDPHLFEWVVDVPQAAVDWLFIAVLQPWRPDTRERLLGMLTQDELRQVAEIEQSKTDFIAIASHELRTPVAVVLGAATTLARTELGLSEEIRAELMEVLCASATRLATMTEQLLDLSALNRSFELEPLRLDALALVELSGHTLVRTPARPPVALANRDALEHVLTNLVANARNHGAEPITVCVERVGGRVELAVEDSGTGVPAEFVPHLFERFTRAGAGEGKPHGAGLGLAIAAAYALAQGGELRYDLSYTGGARFELLLAAADDAAEPTDMQLAEAA